MTMLTLACLSFQTWRPAVNIKDIERSTDKETPGPFNVMPFEQSPRGGIIVKVRVNGRGPFKWLLDTGSSHSAISAELANSLGVTPIADAVVESPIGESMRTIVELNRFEIGPTLTSQVLASVIPAEAATRMRGFQGLIGQDVLATKHYTIDYRGRRLVWLEQRPAASGQVLPLEFDRGRLLVTLAQRSMVLRLVPDSAAEGLVLFRRHNLPLPHGSARRAEVEMATLMEQQYMQQVTLHEFRIGNSILSRVPATIVPSETTQRGTDEPVCDGLLPLRLFERVTFDGPRQLLSVERPRVPTGRTE